MAPAFDEYEHKKLLGNKDGHTPTIKPPTPPKTPPPSTPPNMDMGMYKMLDYAKNKENSRYSSRRTKPFRNYNQNKTYTTNLTEPRRGGVNQDSIPTSTNVSVASVGNQYQDSMQFSKVVPTRVEMEPVLEDPTYVPGTLGGRTTRRPISGDRKFSYGSIPNELGSEERDVTTDMDTFVLNDGGGMDSGDVSFFQNRGLVETNTPSVDVPSDLEVSVPTRPTISTIGMPTRDDAKPSLDVPTMPTETDAPTLNDVPTPGNIIQDSMAAESIPAKPGGVITNPSEADMREAMWEGEEDSYGYNEPYHVDTTYKDDGLPDYVTQYQDNRGNDMVRVETSRGVVEMSLDEYNFMAGDEKESGVNEPPPGGVTTTHRGPPEPQDTVAPIKKWWAHQQYRNATAPQPTPDIPQDDMMETADAVQAGGTVASTPAMPDLTDYPDRGGVDHFVGRGEPDTLKPGYGNNIYTYGSSNVPIYIPEGYDLDNLHEPESPNQGQFVSVSELLEFKNQGGDVRLVTYHYQDASEGGPKALVRAIRDGDKGSSVWAEVDFDVGETVTTQEDYEDADKFIPYVMNMFEHHDIQSRIAMPGVSHAAGSSPITHEIATDFYDGMDQAHSSDLANVITSRNRAGYNYNQDVQSKITTLEDQWRSGNQVGTEYVIPGTYSYDGGMTSEDKAGVITTRNRNPDRYMDAAIVSAHMQLDIGYNFDESNIPISVRSRFMNEDGTIKHREPSDFAVEYDATMKFVESIRNAEFSEMQRNAGIEDPDTGEPYPRTAAGIRAVGALMDIQAEQLELDRAKEAWMFDQSQRNAGYVNPDGSTYYEFNEAGFNQFSAHKDYDFHEWQLEAGITNPATGMPFQNTPEGIAALEAQMQQEQDDAKGRASLHLSIGSSGIVTQSSPYLSQSNDILPHADGNLNAILANAATGTYWDTTVDPSAKGYDLSDSWKHHDAVYYEMPDGSWGILEGDSLMTFRNYAKLVMTDHRYTGDIASDFSIDVNKPYETDSRTNLPVLRGFTYGSYDEVPEEYRPGLDAKLANVLAHLNAHIDMYEAWADQRDAKLAAVKEELRLEHPDYTESQIDTVAEHMIKNPGIATEGGTFVYKAILETRVPAWDSDGKDWFPSHVGDDGYVVYRDDYDISFDPYAGTEPRRSTGTGATMRFARFDTDSLNAQGAGFYSRTYAMTTGYNEPMWGFSAYHDTILALAEEGESTGDTVDRLRAEDPLATVRIRAEAIASGNLGMIYHIPTSSVDEFQGNVGMDWLSGQTFTGSQIQNMLGDELSNRYKVVAPGEDPLVTAMRVTPLGAQYSNTQYVPTGETIWYRDHNNELKSRPEWVVEELDEPRIVVPAQTPREATLSAVRQNPSVDLFVTKVGDDQFQVYNPVATSMAQSLMSLGVPINPGSTNINREHGTGNYGRVFASANKIINLYREGYYPYLQTAQGLTDEVIRYDSIDDVPITSLENVFGSDNIHRMNVELGSEAYVNDPAAVKNRLLNYVGNRSTNEMGDSDLLIVEQGSTGNAYVVLPSTVSKLQSAEDRMSDVLNAGSIRYDPDTMSPKEAGGILGVMTSVYNVGTRRRAVWAFNTISTYDEKNPNYMETLGNFASWDAWTYQNKDLIQDAIRSGAERFAEDRAYVAASGLAQKPTPWKSNEGVRGSAYIQAFGSVRGAIYSGVWDTRDLLLHGALQESYGGTGEAPFKKFGTREYEEKFASLEIMSWGGLDMRQSSANQLFDAAQTSYRSTYASDETRMVTWNKGLLGGTWAEKHDGETGRYDSFRAIHVPFSEFAVDPNLSQYKDYRGRTLTRSGDRLTELQHIGRQNVLDHSAGGSPNTRMQELEWDYLFGNWFSHNNFQMGNSRVIKGPVDRSKFAMWGPQGQYEELSIHSIDAAERQLDLMYQGHYRGMTKDQMRYSMQVYKTGAAMRAEANAKLGAIIQGYEDAKTYYDSDGNVVKGGYFNSPEEYINYTNNMVGAINEGYTLQTQQAEDRASSSAGTKAMEAKQAFWDTVGGAHFTSIEVADPNNPTELIDLMHDVKGDVYHTETGMLLKYTDYTTHDHINSWSAQWHDVLYNNRNPVATTVQQEAILSDPNHIANARNMGTIMGGTAAQLAGAPNAGSPYGTTPQGLYAGYVGYLKGWHNEVQDIRNENAAIALDAVWTNYRRELGSVAARNLSDR